MGEAKTLARAKVAGSDDPAMQIYEADQFRMQSIAALQCGHARRRAGKDQIARHQREQRRQRCQDVGYVVDHVAKQSLLSLHAVHAQPQLRLRVDDRMGG